LQLENKLLARRMHTEEVENESSRSKALSPFCCSQIFSAETQAMLKRILIVAVLGVAGSLAAPASSEAGIYFRPVAPVRRVAARTVLPPYPVARRVIAAPVYPPLVRPVYAPIYGPVGYGVPYVYGGGVSVVVGY
jgi:hypothetical protein